MRLLTPVFGLRLFMRLTATGLGLLAMLWGIRTLPIFLVDSHGNAMAFRITAGAPYKTETLQTALEKQSNTPVTAQYLRSLAIIQMRLIDPDLAWPDRNSIVPSELDKLQILVSKALEWAPSDAYLWLTLFWLRMTKDGATEHALAALRMSYLCGPHEGWIAVPRNRSAMSIFSSLPIRLQNEALTEFKLLIMSGYSKQTAEIFIGPGSSIQPQLLEQIASLPEDSKLQFAKALHTLNDAIIIPGIYDAEHRH